MTNKYNRPGTCPGCGESRLLHSGICTRCRKAGFSRKSGGWGHKNHYPRHTLRSEADKAAIEANVRRYEARAAAGLPIFGD